MDNKKGSFYVLEDNAKEAFLEKIASNYRINKIKGKKYEYTFYDTFDWRLYFNNAFLYFTESKILFVNKSVTFQIDIDTKKTIGNKLFWWNLKESNLRRYLRDIIDARALLKILSIDVIGNDYEVYNKEEKIILTFAIIDISSLKTAIIELIPLKGYKKEFDDISHIILQYATKTEYDYEPFEVIFEKASIKPIIYSTKPTKIISTGTSFDKKEITFKAIKKIMTYMLEVFKVNILGIINDIDTEFLHDFRVIVRRNRAILTQLKNVFVDEKINTYKQFFAEAGNITNVARDLDVFIIMLINLKEKIPPQFIDGYTKIFKYLNKKRTKEYKILKNFLNGEQFKENLKNWQDFLNNSDIEYAGPLGFKSIQETAHYFIYKTFNKTKRKYNILMQYNTPKNLHKFRISCKKLRYVLEIFNVFYNDDLYEKLLEYLKIFQDEVGLSIDIEVQKNLLLASLNDFKNQDRIDDKTLIIYGYLYRILEERQPSSNFIDLYKNISAILKSKHFKKILQQKL